VLRVRSLSDKIKHTRTKSVLIFFLLLLTEAGDNFFDTRVGASHEAQDSESENRHVFRQPPPWPTGTGSSYPTRKQFSLQRKSQGVQSTRSSTTFYEIFTCRVLPESNNFDQSREHESQGGETDCAHKGDKRTQVGNGSCDPD
jgi:hypothetical protein